MINRRYFVMCREPEESGYVLARSRPFMTLAEAEEYARTCAVALSAFVLSAFVAAEVVPKDLPVAP